MVALDPKKLGEVAWTDEWESVNAVRIVSTPIGGWYTQSIIVVIEFV